ncbi:PHP domain-containing protein [Thermoanaerobacter wiegelii]|uniref:PHP domain protein n=1 Tax=Thermoanaerobacter wiegelii Rt8.B1 TaxID=697303 RepID=G2MVK1_9THEO|nr:PHP domain-containing protein [Thermoanaerobacter wiegelii]AEM79129.1 PHP domain protein [Thermoanaerobacter wiegelii Rt8.B1]
MHTYFSSFGEGSIAPGIVTSSSLTRRKYECDLHCHTTRSDGNDTPQELIVNAAKNGLRVVAITDHDVQPPLYLDTTNGKIDIKDFARQQGIELVLGIEFSCDTYVDDVHILGYRMDWKNPLLEEAIERMRKSKTEAYKKLCEVLTSKGMPIDYENEILKYTDENGNIRYRDPDEVERKHIFELMAKKGYAPTWKDAKIMVRDDPELNIRREKINPFDAIDLIKSCGGTAVLAHPFLIDEVIHYPDGSNLTRKEYIERLIKHGIDGIEARYVYSKTSYKGTLKDFEIEELIRTEYNGKVKFFTGGSDYHADHKKGVANPRELGEAGVTFQEFNALKEYLV